MHNYGDNILNSAGLLSSCYATFSTILNTLVFNGAARELETVRVAPVNYGRMEPVDQKVVER